MGQQSQHSWNRIVFNAVEEQLNQFKLNITIQGRISAQPHTTLCIQFLDRENNDKNNRLPLGKEICFTVVWGCVEILPNSVYR